jgi:hypothetical protein
MPRHLYVTIKQLMAERGIFLCSGDMRTVDTRGSFSIRAAKL